MTKKVKTLHKQLSLSSHTVRSLLNAARDKIGTDKRADLALYI